MLKKILSVLMFLTITFLPVASAEWVYVGDYIVDSGFNKVVGNPEYAYNTINNIRALPYNHTGLYYKLYYDSNAQFKKTYNENVGTYISLTVDTCLEPHYVGGGEATRYFGEIYNTITVANKGVFGITVKRHYVVDYPPMVTATQKRFDLNLSSKKSPSGQLGSILKRGSPVEYICQKFDSSIYGSTY